MNRKLTIFLFAILIINTARYSTYILEGNSSVYYIVMLILHILALLYLIIYNLAEAKKKNMSKQVK